MVHRGLGGTGWESVVGTSPKHCPPEVPALEGQKGSPQWGQPCLVSFDSLYRMKE